MAAVAVRATLGSPVLFRQERTGLDGRPFDLVKLRTMRRPGPGQSDPAHDGERLTRLGRFLRDTSIDELPSLLNVLRGDMTLVGPGRCRCGTCPATRPTRPGATRSARV